jgi:hypothetical protein
MITVTAGEVSIHDERRVAIAISGIEPMPVQLVSGRFRPTGLIITYCKPNGGEWQMTAARLYGPKLTKNGDHSKVTGRHEWYFISDVPEEIRDFVDKYLPENGE